MDPALPALERLFVAYREHGDAAALAQVYDRTAPALLAMARRLARGRGEAEDLVQATYVTAIERAGSFDPKRPIVPWLVGILARHARNSARKFRHETANGAASLASDPRLLDSLIELEERAAVASAISDLPEPYRDVLAARLSGESSEVVGKRLGAGPEALRLWAHRGIARLRRLLPASLLGGALAATLDRRAVAAIRGRVLARATATATPAIAGSSLFLGGFLVWKKIAFLAAVLIACTWIAVERLRTAIPRSAKSPEAIEAPMMTEAPWTTTSNPQRVPVTDRPTSLPQSSSSPSIRITGRVIDGSSASERRPIRDAMCSLAGYDDPGGAFAKYGVKTDAEGRFAIACEVYQDIGYAIVSAPSFGRLQRQVQRPSEPLARRDGIDLGDLPLAAGATLQGHVFDAEGRPVAAADLLLYDGPTWTDMFFPSRARLAGRTLADGSFAIDQVPPTSGGFPWRLFAFTSQGCAGKALDVVAGAKLDFEWKLSRMAEVSVDVIDAEGHPVEGAVVSAALIAEPYVLLNLGSVEQLRANPKRWHELALGRDPHLPATLRATTDHAGHATLSALPASFPCAFEITRPGFVSWLSDVVTPSANSATRLRAILATTRFVAIGGRAVDPNGAPLIDGAIERYAAYDSARSPKTGETRTDHDGRFCFGDIEGGTSLDLCIGMPGIARRPLHVDAPTDHDVTDLVLTATPAAPIAGIVADQAGTPIPDASVSIQNASGEILSDSIVTDLAGRFRISNATAGIWKLLVGPPPPAEGWHEAVIAKMVNGGDDNVRIVAIREAIGRAEIMIEVVDAVTRAPLEPRDAFCGERPDRPNLLERARFADERAKGLVRLHRWKIGAWRLRVKCDGHASAYLDFDVTPTDSALRLRVEVPPAARLKGRIVSSDLSGDERKAALARSQVNVRAPDGRSFSEGEILPYVVALHGADTFGFDLVPSGPLTIVFAGGEFVGAAKVDAKPGVEAFVEIRIVRAGTLKTLGAAGLPHGDSHLVFSSADSIESWLGLGWPGRNPKDTNAKLAPGRWRWRLFVVPEGEDSTTVRGGDSPIAEGTVEVRAGETTELQLPMPRH